jgi:hypothetical protein
VVTAVIAAIERAAWAGWPETARLGALLAVAAAAVALVVAASSADLRDAGLVTIGRQAVNPDSFDLERVRNTYTLKPAILDAPAVRRQVPAKHP